MSPTTQGRLMEAGAPPVLIMAVCYLLKLGVRRDLHMVELFSGAGHLHSAFTRAGLHAAGFDRSSCKDDDILRTGGFLRALRLVLRLRVAGLLFTGTPCSSWIFLSRGSTQRSSTNPLGNQRLQNVLSANVTVARTALLCLVAWARGAQWATEQPGSSLMPMHPRLVQMRDLGAHMCASDVSGILRAPYVGSSFG